MTYLSQAIGHDADLAVDYEPGAHPGWDDYWFTCNGRRFRLLTINTDREKKSHISMSDQPHDALDNIIWPSWQIIVLPCVITPEAAFEIIAAAYDNFAKGTTYGRRQKALEIQKALQPE